MHVSTNNYNRPILVPSAPSVVWSGLLHVSVCLSMTAVIINHIVLALTLLLSMADKTVTAFTLTFKPQLMCHYLVSIYTYKNDNDNINKGLHLLEIASSIVPQGWIVSTVKQTWKFAWKRMMTELAPQDPKGRYSRPSYFFKEFIGCQKNFPDEPGRYHQNFDNPCPWCHQAWLVIAVLGLANSNRS